MNTLTATGDNANSTRASVTVTAEVTLQDANGKAVSGVIAAVNWQLPVGKISSQTATTSKTGLAF